MSVVCDSLDDIEDFGKEMDEDQVRMKHSVHQVGKKFRPAKVKVQDYDDLPTSDAISNIPGIQHIYIHTWGCSHNNSDSEYMAGMLQAYGYQVSLNNTCCATVDADTPQVTLQDKQKQADLWLLNSCTVKNPAEDHFRNLVMQAKQWNKRLVVAGCVPQGQPSSDYIKDVSIIGVQQIDRVVEVVEETLKGNTVRFLAPKKAGGKKLGGASLELPKLRRNPFVEILAINTGCLNACTYCKTKHARGHLGSYSIEEITERAKQAFAEGCVEIWLTSEDLGAYGRDLGVRLPDLLQALTQPDVIPAGCMLRLGMTNPPYILQDLDAIAEVLNHPRVYAFLHIPVQTGSDAVLGEMKREYTREDFSRVVDTLRAKVPGVTVATDIICGFPTELEEDFEETVSLLDKYKFSVLYINQFYPRPGTPAAKMQRVASPAEVKKRTKRLHDLFRSYETYQHRLGQVMNVLVTEDSTDHAFWVGHNKAYEQILLPKEPDLLGKVVEVKIVECGKHFMKAEIVNRQPKCLNLQLPPPGSLTVMNPPSHKLKPNFLVFLTLAVLLISIVPRMLLHLVPYSANS